MKFIIQDYLSVLKEREELDYILPDLLRAMGWQIVKLAFRGEVEHGVDIAAYDKKGNTLYLIQVKPGDISSNWDSGPNSIRTTLNNILDVSFEDISKPELRNSRKVTILAHNGTVRENIKSRFNGYLENDFIPRMEFQRWDLDKLTNLFEEHLFNERILPKEYQKLLKRTLVFLEVPDYDLKDFKKLISGILPNVKKISKIKRQRLFGFLRLMLALILKESRELNNLQPALEAFEYSTLYVWGWMYKNNFFSRPFQREFLWTYKFFLEVFLEWNGKMSLALITPEGLALGGTFETVEYPMRTFKVIGNLGLLSLLLTLDIPDVKAAQQTFSNTVEFLKQTIKNNPSRHRPLLDNHSIDIFLGMWSLFASKDCDFAIWSLTDIFEHLVIRKKYSGRLPELYNNIDKVIEYEVTSERPIGYIDQSSTLIYMLFEFTLLFNVQQIYDRYRVFFDDINLQVWYPPENVEEILYFREVHEGKVETSIVLPEKFEDFKLDVKARYTLEKHDYSTFKYGFFSLPLLANKHHRTPVFPFWWRQSIFNTEDPENN